MPTGFLPATPKDQYYADRGACVVNTYSMSCSGMIGLPCRALAEVQTADASNRKAGEKERKMLIAQIMEGMIAYSEGNIHDIDHFLRVWSYARAIGMLEGLDERTQRVLEVAAIVHDIACPICREKYGNTNGKRQEEEGAPLAAEFLRSYDLEASQIERVAYLVGHHHTFNAVDGVDYQILIEADYIANASENGWSKDIVCSFMDRKFKTEAGRRLARSVFQL